MGHLAAPVTAFTRLHTSCMLPPGSMLKRTPLYDLHREHGGKLIEFGGWEMPVHYTSISDEHLAVRKAAGIFDISHMGEVEVKGPGAAAFLNRVLTNEILKLSPGVGQYTLMCNQEGGVIDDLYAYQRGVDDYLLIINASRIDVDVAWLEKQAAEIGIEGVTLQNCSDANAAVAVQGPEVVKFIGRVAGGSSQAGAQVTSVLNLKKNQIAAFDFEGNEIWVSRTGYTGEDGFEIVCAPAVAGAVWKAVVAVGQPFGVKPCGLGARDTLRTEVCYPLYGHELDEQTSPIEAGLGFFVAMDKAEFNGQCSLRGQKADGPSKKLVAFKMIGKTAPPRPHYAVLDTQRRPMGQVTSGTQSPSLGLGIGLGYVIPSQASPGTEILIEIRGKAAPAVIVPKPIYRKPN